MIKTPFLIGLLLSIGSLKTCAQEQVFSTTKGEMTFFSNAPLEDISAKNSRVISMLNTRNLELVVRVPINQFEFSNNLMQQHFNDNYLESDKYPYATFKGKLNPIPDFTKTGVYDVSATGVLSIHGVEQKRTITGKLSISADGVDIDSRFSVALADHKIDIPKLVTKKNAEKIAVRALLHYQPFKK